MRESIKLELSDWLYNAGIVGMVNILKHAKDEVKYEGQSVSFGVECLDNFEEKYFNYFIDTYEKTMTYTKIIEKIDKIINMESVEDFEKTKDDIKYIKDKMKNSAYKDLVNSNDLDLTLNKKDIDYDKIKKLKNKLYNNKKQILKSEIIGYYDQKSKKSKAPNAIIDKYINTNMLEISYLLGEIKKNKEINKNSFDFNCFACNVQINKIENGLNFLNRMFFDTNRKTSHVWNFVSDIEVCPICKLIYYCIPAGFTTVYGKGVFINENQYVKIAVDINHTIKYKILNDNESIGNYSTYRALITAIQESINDNVKYELADIQVVRYEEERYKFNILSKNSLKILKESKEELNSILKSGFKEVNTYFNIYEETMDKVLNNENQFLLIHKTLTLKTSVCSDLHYNIGHVKSMLKINFNFMKGVGYMENIEKDILKSSSGAGYYLKEAYKNKKSENKLNGIAYRLLNALKTNNKSMFMDTLLNCYMYTNKMVPQFFVDCLKDDVIFKTIGYSFVSGLIDGEEYKKTNGGVINE